jgi:hypothetical protein
MSASETAIAAIDTAVRELDRRINDGFDVRLLWNSRTNCVFVSIEDQRHGAIFEFQVDGSDALEAFHHPFTYRRDEWRVMQTPSLPERS